MTLFFPHLPMLKKFMVATFATVLLAGTAIADEGTNNASSYSSSSSSSSSSQSRSIPEPEELRKKEERLRKENMHRNQNGRREDARVLDVGCIQAAVMKREDAIIAALDAFYAAKKAAHIVHRDALVAAWALPDATARKEARKAAEMAFGESMKTARKAWHDARKAAKKTFKTERKACHAPTEPEPEVSGNPAA